MANLIAYIPVFNERHRKWTLSHPNSVLFLISQGMAESLLPRLARNIVALPTEMTSSMILNSKELVGVRDVKIFSPNWFSLPDAILPDEDISHILVEKYFRPVGCEATFEMIWARWDMTAVKRQSPVMEGIEVTTSHNLRMDVARKIAPKSPDWWRQIGAALFLHGSCVAVACNTHYPTEYEQDAMGDPRMNYDAGQIGKYLSLHSEKAVLLQCAYQGIPTRGSNLYTTVFPCEDCARAIAVAGVDHVFFEEGYSALDAREILIGAGIKIVQVKKDPVSA